MGRSDLYRIGETWVKLVDLETLLYNHFSDSANIVIDVDLQKIYLAIWEENLRSEEVFK